MNELEARRAPIELAHEAPFTLGGMPVRPASREIVLAGKAQVLQPRVIQVLVALAKCRGDVVSRDDLVASCWDGLAVSEDAINRCIAQLRRVAEQEGGGSFAIETIAKVGYRLTPAPGAPDATAPRAPPEPHPQVEPISVAVLPFANMSPDPDQEYFSDGLTEELINQLSQIKALRVAGRTSSFAFKGKLDDLRVIGQRLGVTHVLEGSVRKAGSRLRITAQLIECGDGYHLWSDKFDREVADVFAIQDEIAEAVASALSVTLGIGETTCLPGGTSNAEAFDLMLRARAVIRRRGSGDAQRAVALLHQALALDPEFALAWNVLGNALTSVLSFDPEDREAMVKEIDEALGRSMALAPDLWTAHEACANQLELRHDWVGAEQANARSRALAPKSMREPMKSRANQLASVGRVSEAIPFAREAERIEPMAPFITLEGLLDLVGRHDEAEAEYERRKDLPRDQLLEDLIALERAMGRKNHALVKERLAICAGLERSPQSLNRILLGVIDDSDRASEVLRRTLQEIKQPGSEVSRLLSLAGFAAYFGDHELALTAYRSIVANLLSGVMISRIWSPLFADMRKLPGFKDLVRELNLVTYWRTTGNWGEFARSLDNDDFEIYR